MGNTAKYVMKSLDYQGSGDVSAVVISGAAGDNNIAALVYPNTIVEAIDDDSTQVTDNGLPVRDT